MTRKSNPPLNRIHRYLAALFELVEFSFASLGFLQRSVQPHLRGVVTAGRLLLSSFHSLHLLHVTHSQRVRLNDKNNVVIFLPCTNLRNCMSWWTGEKSWNAKVILKIDGKNMSKLVDHHTQPEHTHTPCKHQNHEHGHWHRTHTYRISAH